MHVIDCNEATLKLFRCPDRETFFTTDLQQLSSPVQANGIDSIQMSQQVANLAINRGGICLNGFIAAWIRKPTL